MTDELDGRIDRFFTGQLLPLAAKAKAAGARFLQTEQDPAATTYYTSRSRTSMQKADFESGGCASVDGVRADLDALWRDERELGLDHLSAGVAALAKDLRAVGKDASEVSNFIYVMY